jgi:hypothetical protein
MSKTVRASALILLLACTARADWIPNGLTAPPPPPPSAVQEPTDADQEPTTPGIMPNGAAESLTQTALDLLALLPSLL